jgi:hypothetical protein
MSTHDHDDRTGRWRRWFAPGRRIVPALVVGAGAIALAAINWGVIDLPDWFGAVGAIPRPEAR